jgi:hypothetical protein
LESLAAAAKQFAKWLVIVSTADLVLAVAWAELKGKAVAASITGAFFISGGIIFVGAAFAGGGGRGRRSDLLSGRDRPTEMPFAGVLLGVALIGIGLLTIVL